MRRLWLIARHETRLLFTDPLPLMLLIAMPVVLLSFLSDGLVGGPAHAVPGLDAMFGFFGLSVAGLAFFRDHGWGTWDRLRMSPASRAEVMLGKALPLIVLLLIQQAVLLFLGWRFFDMPWEGSLAAGALVVVATVAVEAALALLVVAVCRTIDQVGAVSYMGALLLAGFGGALAPLDRLPGWVGDVGHASPVYWTLEGLEVGVAGDPAGDVLAPVGVLLAIAAVAGALAAWRYRFDAPKTYFS